MNILLLVNNFPPEIGSAADLFYRLALEFNKKGHKLNIITTQPRFYNLSNIQKKQYTKKDVSFRLWDLERIHNSINVYRIKLIPLIYPRSGHNSFFRKLEHIFQPLTFISLSYLFYISDIVLVYSPPLILGYIATILGKIFRKPVIVNVQDIHPKAIIDLGLIKNPLIIFILKIIELQMYRLASAITVHSDGNRKIIIEHGINPQKIHIIFNACKIPSDEIIEKGKIFKNKLFLKNKFIVTYAGTMSYSQDLETIIYAAKILSTKISNIVFILAGNGPQRQNLELLSKRLKVKNVIFLPFQENDDYWRLLSASDICLVSLKSSKVKTPVVPRKLEDIMAVGKPVIANVPLNGDVKKFIDRAKCGIAVEAEDPHLLANAIILMYGLPKEIRSHYGRNGRLFAIQNFSPQVIANRYENLFFSLLKSQKSSQ